MLRSSPNGREKGAHCTACAARYLSQGLRPHTTTSLHIARSQTCRAAFHGGAVSLRVPLALLFTGGTPDDVSILRGADSRFMPRMLCTTVHHARPDPDATNCRQAFCVSGLAVTRCGTPLRRGWTYGGSGGWDRLVSAPEFLQQHLGFLEVGGVKALSEPAVHLRQQLASLLALALLLP